MGALDDIVCSPDPRLHQVCEPIDQITGSVKQLAKRMLKCMYAADGVGLAACQIGEMVRLAVVDVDWGAGEKNPYVLINPTIIEANGEEITSEEGCLSFPGIRVPVSRPSHVIVQALNLDGDLMQYEAADNLLAVCLQHEIDHLNGITMIEHLSPAERVAAMRRYAAALEAGARPGDTTIIE
ncbi:MAG: peptide deformylase [Atopobiaceae bacterium]|nr:peptide deformylase [Atopobiaceae bacterium]